MSTSDDEYHHNHHRQSQHSHEFMSLFGSLLRVAPYILVPLAIVNGRSVINWLGRFVRGLRVRLSRPSRELLLTLPTAILFLHLSRSIILHGQASSRPTQLTSKIDLTNINYFWLTRTRPESPAYMVRNQFREYLLDLGTTDPKLAGLVAERRRRGWTEESASLAEIIDPKDPMEVQLVLLTALSQSMRVSTVKQAYLEWGPRAVIPSLLKGLLRDFRKANNDTAALPDLLNDPRLQATIEDDLGGAVEERFVSAVPELCWRHLVFLSVMGILGMVRLKSRWPRIATVCTILLIIHDAAVLYFYRDTVPIFDAIWPRDRFSLRLEKMLQLQNLLYAILSLLAILFDLRAWDEQDDPERNQLLRTLTSVETIVGLLQLIRLQRTTVMLDEHLRRHFWEHYRLLEVQNQRLFADEEFRTAQANLRRSHNLDDLIAQNQEALDRTFQQMNESLSKRDNDPPEEADTTTATTTTNLDRNKKNKKKQQ